MTAADINAAVGAAIRTRRKELHLSQTALGAVAGIGRGQQQKYESGENRVPADALLAFARCLDVPVAFFFAAVDGKAAEEARLVTEMRALTRAQRQAIQINIKAFAKGER